MTESPTIHASAVLVGAKAALIRGPAGSGKSALAIALLRSAQQGALAFAHLVADDRAALQVCSGRLLVRPAQALAGMIELRGLGILRFPFEPVAVIGAVVDLAAVDAARLPADVAMTATVQGVTLSRLPVAPGIDPLGPVLAFLRAQPGGI